MTCQRKLVDCRLICRPSLDGVSIEISIEMSIEGIDRHSIADAFSTHDPLNQGPTILHTKNLAVNLWQNSWFVISVNIFYFNVNL